MFASWEWTRTLARSTAELKHLRSEHLLHIVLWLPEHVVVEATPWGVSEATSVHPHWPTYPMRSAWGLEIAKALPRKPSISLNPNRPCFFSSSLGMSIPAAALGHHHGLETPCRPSVVIASGFCCSWKARHLRHSSAVMANTGGGHGANCGKFFRFLSSNSLCSPKKRCPW